MANWNESGADAELKRVVHELGSALLASRSGLSRYDAARHEDSLVTLLWAPAVERNAALVARPEITRAALKETQATGAQVVMVLEKVGVIAAYMGKLK